MSTINESRHRSRSRSQDPNVNRSLPGPLPDTPSKSRSANVLSTIPVSSSRRQTLILGVLFVLALVLLFVLFRSFPTLNESDRAQLVFPRSLRDVRRLSNVLRKYRDQHMGSVVAAFCAIYIFLQAFAIPGALFLSILAGPLFGIWRGLALVSLVATTGSAICFQISSRLGRGLVAKYFPGMLDSFRKKVHAQRRNLFFYLLFLRISPLLPNWFISVSSPLLGIPFHLFVAATFLGLMPANYIHVSTGVQLEAMEAYVTNDGSGSDPDAERPAVQWKNLLFLLGLACLALLPTLFKKKLAQMDEAATNNASASRMEPSSPTVSKQLSDPDVAVTSSSSVDDESGVMNGVVSSGNGMASRRPQRQRSSSPSLSPSPSPSPSPDAEAGTAGLIGKSGRGRRSQTHHEQPLDADGYPINMRVTRSRSRSRSGVRASTRARSGSRKKKASRSRTTTEDKSL